MAKVEALITPSVMCWARERSVLSIEEAARKIGRPEEDIIAWESGKLLPSIPQARRAAEVYKRPLAVFYLLEPPRDFETLRDYRSLPADYPPEYSQNLSLLIRTAQFRQEWMREFLIEEGLPALPFVGSASLSDSPKSISQDILQNLQLTPKEQTDCHTRREALRLWLERAERVGIFIFQQGQIDLKEARGFVICDEYAPFIYINSEDAQAAQLFTVVHELAHLWLNLSGVSNFEHSEIVHQKDFSSIETFCNKVAAEAVLNQKYFYRALNELDDSNPVIDKIESLANYFNVSEEVIARRLLDDDVIGKDTYLELRDLYQQRWIEYKRMERRRMKAAGGGPSYYTRKVFNNGYSFTQTVVSAYESGAISGREASGLLEVKVNHIQRLASTAGMPGFG